MPTRTAKVETAISTHDACVPELLGQTDRRNGGHTSVPVLLSKTWAGGYSGTITRSLMNERRGFPPPAMFWTQIPLTAAHSPACPYVFTG